MRIAPFQINLYYERLLRQDIFICFCFAQRIDAAL